MKIQVLGSGCAKCKALTQAAEDVAHELGITDPVEKVTDMQQIMSFNVMSTPALVVDGKVKMSGKLPSHDELVAALSSAT